MKHIKLFEGFINEANGNVLLSWKKMVDGWAESTACIIDKDFKVLDTINMVFGKDGEFSKETVEKKKKYGIKGATFGKGADYILISNSNEEVKNGKVVFNLKELTPEKAIEKYKEDLDQTSRIKKFLTPEVEKELIAMFKKKKKNESFNEKIEVMDVIPSIDDIKAFYTDVEKLGQHATLDKYKKEGWANTLIDSLFQGYATNIDPEEKRKLILKSFQS